MVASGNNYRMSKWMRRLLYTIASCISATACLAQAENPPPTAEPDPRATFQKLKNVASNNSLDFQTSFAADSKTRPARGAVHFQIKRPNLFRIEGSAGRAKYVLVSDGKMMTIYNPGERRFTEVAAPASAAEGMALLTGLASTQSQVLALVRLIADVASDEAGTKVVSVGTDMVDGRQCKRFTVVQNAESWWPERWVVWLEDKDSPMPCKFRVTTTDSLTRDVQTNQITWKSDPTFSDETFQFTPPRGSKKVGSVGALGLHPPTN
jgi:outer membrane lipoprotein-sorting protein